MPITQIVIVNKQHVVVLNEVDCIFTLVELFRSLVYHKLNYIDCKIQQSKVLPKFI